MKKYVVKNVSEYMVEIEVNGKKEFLKPDEEKVFSVIPTTKFKGFIQVTERELNNSKEDVKKEVKGKENTQEKQEKQETEKQEKPRRRGRKKKSN